jgi:hypothetical protein
MADTHICNDIKQFKNFVPANTTAPAGDRGMEIRGYGDIQLAIEVGKQRLIRHLTLKKVAYAPKSHINLVCAAKLRKVGVIIDQETNHLRYKDDGSLFANLTERSDLYLIDVTTVPPVVPPAVQPAIPQPMPTVTVHAVSTTKHFKATAPTSNEQDQLITQQTPTLPDPGPLSGGERHSGREEHPSAKAKEMPNQDPGQQAFVSQVGLKYAAESKAAVQTETCGHPSGSTDQTVFETKSSIIYGNVGIT